MEHHKGKSIFGGIAIGKISVYTKQQRTVKRERIEDIAAELTRFEAARVQAIDELHTLYEKAVLEVGQTNAMIFDIHSMMLEDEDYLESITHMIEGQQVNAEFAVATTGDNFSKMFAEMDDDYMKERAADVKDISERVIKTLLGAGTDDILSDEPVIVVADDLAPSETVQMDKNKLLAFVTRLGSTNSHTAILARTMNIPALVGVKISNAWHGKLAVVDGYSGTLYINPDADTLAAMQKRMNEDKEQRRLLSALKGKECITLDGKRVKVYANIGSVADVAHVLKNDAAGIGLFRSEFLYLEKASYPTEEEQFHAYRTVAENMAGKPVLIRTLDIGADKQVGYFNIENEENPAMGYRAIRICLDRPEIFKTQLRALLRASAFGNISIMYPMIISISEIRQIKQIVELVKAELISQGCEIGAFEQGVMIETPAAVMISRELADEVDFFSIGTNDLTQYTLAIDRQNAKLDSIYDAHHPAVMRMIEMTVQNAHAGGCWVGICGELGADMRLTETFLRMGIDELSVSPSFILPLRYKIREMDLSK